LFDLFLVPRKRPPSVTTGDYPIRADHPPISISAFPKVVMKLHRGDNIGFKTEYNVSNTFFITIFSVAIQLKIEQSTCNPMSSFF